MRDYWIQTMLKIADPVLNYLATRTLHHAIPMNFHPDRKPYAMLEALGRTACGMAPWLEMEGAVGEEAMLQEKYRKRMREAIDAATDPQSADYMNFSQGYGQALVDAAFLAHAVVRAPKQMFALLDENVKKNFVQALKETRKFVPFVSNWLLFSAMVEAALYVMGEDDYDLVRVEYAVNSFQKWYVGDGTYGDGDYFHWDYYNSFVIHPMLVDILRTFRAIRPEYERFYPTVEKRAARYAQVLEQLINADGTYPVIGRSVVYRFGAFQALSQAALEEYLPAELPYGQVRCALNAVIHKVMKNNNMFDSDGWLTPGVYGEQPYLAEGYICVGSLYLCEAVFLPLGLTPTHRFWTEENQDWTAKKIWSGQNIMCDHAID
ncbi:MAG: DUF2264 domain-containing protein [Lachnospiraceae bacterium]|nr:DUF2264 domain-containing protein [Lachnospiraceae bacterium]